MKGCPIICRISGKKSQLMLPFLSLSNALNAFLSTETSMTRSLLGASVTKKKQWLEKGILLPISTLEPIERRVLMPSVLRGSDENSLQSRVLEFSTLESSEGLRKQRYILSLTKRELE